MISSSKEVDSPSEKEGDHASSYHDHGKSSTKASSSSSATPWLRLKDPRIVRVSRAFGGKDRHSKVCTIRGLRDRRVRLSVPTAIQLYDLQDRLGLNQPSKVVDWLLNAAKHEIDELPPLPIPPVNFALNHQAMLSSSEIGASQSNKLNSSISWEENQGVVLSSTRPNFWTTDAHLKNKSKHVATSEKENWTTRRNEEDNKQKSNEVAASSSFFPRTTHSSSPAGLINNAIPYTSFFQLEHPSFPLSHMGSHGFVSQTDYHHDLHNLNSIPLPSTLSLSSGSQIFPYFPSHATTEIDHPKQINHFQMLTPSAQTLFPNSLTPTPFSLNQSARPFHFSVTNPRLFHSHNSGSQPDKDQDQFPSK
ncbi:hypothetical protein JCGZ_19956 [Jatropha curcas]|uniref:TCP domain-containing protein n=1 Tax=Jatropha curcas TaxID=180498 RepID=A0A067JTR2_JATCU|nr:transcription factor TCP13 [Jatropha curcas]KDP27257.1 hypothetical protein JCGZ_19956 [Jatropha curcas]